MSTLEARRMRLARRLISWQCVAAAAMLAAALVASACGGGNQGGRTPTPDRFVPTIPSLPTVGVDPLDVPLTTFRSATGRYSIDIPAGWMSTGVGVTLEEAFQFHSDNLLRAEVGISCEPLITRDGRLWTAADYAQRDQGFIAALGSQVGGGFDGQSPISVDGVQGVEAAYHITLSGIPVRQLAVYFIKNDCAWSLHLRVFGTGDPQPFLALFGRMVQSFRSI